MNRTRAIMDSYIELVSQTSDKDTLIEIGRQWLTDYRVVLPRKGEVMDVILRRIQFVTEGSA